MTTIWGPGAIEYRFQQYRELESAFAAEQAQEFVNKRPHAPPIDFFDNGAGLRFLHRFKNNPIALAELKGLLLRYNLGADLCLLTADEALSALATLLYWGRIVVTERVMAQPGVFNVDNEAPASLAAPAPAAPAPSTAEPEDESPTLPDNDGALQAAALKAAAQAGVPFCEECAKAAAAAAAKN